MVKEGLKRGETPAVLQKRIELGRAKSEALQAKKEK